MRQMFQWCIEGQTKLLLRIVIKTLHVISDKNCLLKETNTNINLLVSSNPKLKNSFSTPKTYIYTH